MSFFRDAALYPVARASGSSWYRVMAHRSDRALEAGLAAACLYGLRLAGLERAATTDARRQLAAMLPPSMEGTPHAAGPPDRGMLSAQGGLAAVPAGVAAEARERVWSAVQIVLGPPSPTRVTAPLINLAWAGKALSITAPPQVGPGDKAPRKLFTVAQDTMQLVAAAAADAADPTVQGETGCLMPWLVLYRRSNIGPLKAQWRARELVTLDPQLQPLFWQWWRHGIAPTERLGGWGYGELLKLVGDPVVAWPMWDFALRSPDWFLAWLDDRKVRGLDGCGLIDGTIYKEPELAGLLTQAGPEQLRAVILAMCTLAMEMLPSPFPPADRAFAAVLAGKTGRPFAWVDLAEAAAGSGREWFWSGDRNRIRHNIEMAVCGTLWAALGDEPRIAAMDAIDCARNVAGSRGYARQGSSSADPWPEVRAAVLRALAPLTDEQRTTMLWWQRMPAPEFIEEVAHRLPDPGLDISRQDGD